jgi:hypothetical protein
MKPDEHAKLLKDVADFRNRVNGMTVPERHAAALVEIVMELKFIRAHIGACDDCLNEIANKIVRPTT